MLLTDEQEREAQEWAEYEGPAPKNVHEAFFTGMVQGMHDFWSFRDIKKRREYMKLADLDTPVSRRVWQIRQEMRKTTRPYSPLGLTLVVIWMLASIAMLVYAATVIF